MKRLLGLALAGVVMAAATACSGQGAKPSSKPAASAQVDATVDTTIEAFGTIQSSKVRHLVLDFPARIEEVLVREGQRVKKGDPLLRVNLEEYNAQIAIKEQELTLARNEGIKARIAIVEQELATLKGRLNKEFLKETTIVSDQDDAIVSEIGVAAGDAAAPGQKVITLWGLDGLRVQANVLEEFIKDVKVGAKVTFRPSADKSKEYTGTVASIAKMAFQSRNGETTVPVEVTVEKADDFLMPGFNVELKIHK